MITEIAIWMIVLVAIGTYFLQLWTGIAVAGWAGDFKLVERETKPGPYWFVMLLQTALMIVVPALIYFSE